MIEPIGPLPAFAATGSVSLAMAWLARHLLRHPLSRLYPTALKHRWALGVFCIAALYLNLTVPFVLIGDPGVAAAAFVLTTGIVWLWGREFVDWIVADLREHRHDLRSLFSHSAACAVSGHVHQVARDHAGIEGGTARARVIDAWASAIAFLESRQHPDGSWRDFLAPGEGVDWVTAYVAVCLRDMDFGQASPSSVARAQAYLARTRQPSGGWGFGSGVPADADSTALALLALSDGSGGAEHIAPALSWLLRHQDEASGGFVTYANAGTIAAFLGTSGDGFAGWCSPHVCVTAVASRALFRLRERDAALERALDFVRGAQHDEGYWEAFWWNGRTYATAQCIRALSGTGVIEDVSRVEKAQRWLCAQQSPAGYWSDGTAAAEVPFATACAVSGLLAMPNTAFDAHVVRGVDRIVGSQRRDGSWNGAPILRIPHPGHVAPWETKAWPAHNRATGVVIPDHNRVFTTATAVSTLAAYLRRA